MALKYYCAWQRALATCAMRKDIDGNYIIIVTAVGAQKYLGENFAVHGLEILFNVHFLSRVAVTITFTSNKIYKQNILAPHQRLDLIV